MRIREYIDKEGNIQESIILSKEEQPTWYKHCIGMIMSHTGYVLENLEDLPEFQVNWEDYHTDDYWVKKHAKTSKKPKPL